ncbi:MAG: hypothetical protein LKI58_13240 [Actinomyces sp.]|jgi:hypothetical protein|nr:hypothetical protein [Actinomyces sp.]MCI1788996.1 hypothetical protein [Actinomyces sp.]MCI1830421.1 hypothetical protein [Actinomyces sp.]
MFTLIIYMVPLLTDVDGIVAAWIPVILLAHGVGTRAITLAAAGFGVIGSLLITQVVHSARRRSSALVQAEHASPAVARSEAPQ